MQDFIGGFSFQQLFQRIFYQALRQHFRCVVGGGFFPLPPGKSIDESAFFISAELSFFISSVRIVPLIADALILGVLIQLFLAHKVTDVQIIEAVPGAFDLKQGMLRDEAPVGKQSLINAAHLVDAEVGIGNASAAVVSPSGLSGQTHEVDDAQHDGVSQLRRRDHLCVFRIEDMGFQGSNHEHIVEALLLGVFQDLFFRCRVPVVNQVIQFGEGLMQIVAAANFRHVVPDIISDVPQAFQ